MQAIVDFMYKGEISVGHEQLASLMNAAESLQVWSRSPALCTASLIPSYVCAIGCKSVFAIIRWFRSEAWRIPNKYQCATSKATKKKKVRPATTVVLVVKRTTLLGDPHLVILCPLPVIYIRIIIQIWIPLQSWYQVMILMLDYLNYQLCQIFRLTILSPIEIVNLHYQEENR